MTIEQLSWFVDDAVAKRLLAIDGMARSSATAASTAKSASSSIRRGCSRLALPPRRSTRPCAS